MIPLLETRRCRLRAFESKDVLAFTLYRQNPEVARFQSWSSYSLAEAEALLATCQEVPFGTLGSWHQLALAEKASDRLLGDVGLHFLDVHAVELGFTLAPEAQGKGLLTEALEGLIPYLFEQRGIAQLRATTDALNAPSIRLLTRLGFEQETLVPRPVIFKDMPGEELDFLLTQERWRAHTPTGR